MPIKYEWEGKQIVASVAQAYNELHRPDKKLRTAVFQGWEASFAENQDLYAAMLNRVAGFRLKTYGLRGWKSFLEEPLTLNRTSEKTLDAMWEAVEAKVSVLTQFLAHRAGAEKLSWVDVEVPSTPSVSQNISYEEGQKFIIDQFERFSPLMAAYAKQAFEEQAIECEDRPGKRAGGFCTSFPISKTSRIFMTWSNTRDNLTTLAHELGHGFHSAMIFDQPPLATHYPMTLAETASTFAEQIISEGLLDPARTEMNAMCSSKSAPFAVSCF